MPTAVFDPDVALADLTRQTGTAIAEEHGEQVLLAGEGLWREDPVDFTTFVNSPEHLNLGKTPLFPRQAAAVLSLLGADPKRMFEEPTAADLRPLAWRRFGKSSNVLRCAFTAEHGLVIEFRDQSVYSYPRAPRHVFQGLVSAPSKGKYVAAVVKRGHQSQRLEAKADDLRERTAQRAAREYQLGVLLWGKGSGKDYLCSIVVAYLMYVLLCLRDPQSYFDLAPGENIDVVNVAFNADQAKRVFFEKFKQRLWRWGWLRKNFDVHEGGRRKWPGNKGLPKVEINDGEILWPRNIRCFSKHSQNESYEGLNVIAWVMDEASAFLSQAKKENATAIYQTLRTSAASRFQRRWVGFIISYPRHADDFTCQKVREARAHPDAGIYADGPAATWEVNENLGRGEWVEVRPGHRVPVELANDYLLDFEEALSKYEAQPPLARDALLKDGERVWGAVRRGRAPLIEWEPRVTRRSIVDGEGEEVTREFAAVKITKLGKLPKGTKLYGHGDPARSSDGFALAFGHGVPATVLIHVPAGEVLSVRQIDAANEGEAARAAAEGREPKLLEPETLVPWERDVTKTVIDAVIVWRPDPKRNRHVDLLNVREVLTELVLGRHYRIGGITFDHYDSAETVQTFQAKKVPFENEQWSNPFQHRIYRGARSAFYNDLVELPDTPTIVSEDPSAPGAIYELLRVEEIEGHKIDHPEGGSKDCADALVRVIEHVTGATKLAFSFGTLKNGSGHTGKTTVPGKTVDPERTPSPATPTMRAKEAKRAAERPEAELEAGTGEVLVEEPVPRRRMSFGVARPGGPPMRPQ